jgi:hypothetical protein
MQHSMKNPSIKKSQGEDISAKVAQDLHLDTTTWNVEFPQVIQPQGVNNV